MTNLSAEEIRQRNVEIMGTPLGEQFSALWQEVASLHSKWREFVTLFGERESRIEIMNRAAPKFFRDVQDCLWRDTLLYLARITDPPLTGKKANLSICGLSTLVNDGLLAVRLRSMVDAAVCSTAFCRDWRNRHIAHTDLLLAIGNGAQPLESASRKQVIAALEAIAEVLNEVSIFFLKSETHFLPISHQGGGLDLIYVLDDGLKADSERRERGKRREYRADDLRAKDL